MTAPGSSSAGASASVPSAIRLFVYHDALGIIPRLCEIAADGSFLPIETYAEENSASAEVFGRVVRQVLRDYPATSYGLVVFSHASGWLPEGRLNKPVKKDDRAASSRSVIMDGSREMELVDFASAIPDGAFDWITFEACYMAGIEVAYELRNKTDYILASSAEIVSPGFTLIYKSSLGDLLAPATPQSFGQAVYDNAMTYAATDYRRSATYSMIRTSALEPLAAFVRENCDLGREEYPAAVISPSTVQHFDRPVKGGYNLFFDFEDYFSRLIDDTALSSELGRLLRAAVVWREATPSFLPTYGGFAVDKHSGLTTYIRQPDLTYLNDAYHNLQWAKAIKP